MLALCLFLGQSAWAAQSHLAPNESYVGISEVSYVNPNYETEKERNIPLYSGRVSELSEGEAFSFGYNMEGQFSPEARTMNSFTVNELYVYGSPDWAENTLVFGRKTQNFSLMDRDLALGLVEPNYRVDPLRRHSQGLIGLFLKVEKSQFNLQIFASSFYFPNQGPSMEIRSGQFVKGHPWVNLPPEQVMVMGESTNVNYQIDQPDLSQVFFQNSYGAQIESPTYQTLRGKLFYFNKPNNQLALGYDGKLLLDSKDPYLDIKIHPEVVRSTLRGAELIYKTEQIESYVSHVQEEPEDYKFSYPWTYQKFTLTEITGLGLSFKKQKLTLSISAAMRQGGEVKEIGPNASESTKILSSPYQFNSLLSLKAEYNWKFPRREENRILLKWDQEIKENSEVLSLQLDHQIEKYWFVTLGFDLLRAQKVASNNPSIYSQNLNNDRFFGGFNYVF